MRGVRELRGDRERRVSTATEFHREAQSFTEISLRSSVLPCETLWPY